MHLIYGPNSEEGVNLGGKLIKALLFGDGQLMVGSTCKE